MGEKQTSSWCWYYLLAMIKKPRFCPPRDVCIKEIKYHLLFGLNSAGSGSVTEEVALDLHHHVEHYLQHWEVHLRRLGTDGWPFLLPRSRLPYPARFGVQPGTPIPCLFTPMPSDNHENGN